MSTLPFSERDLKTLLNNGQIQHGPFNIVLHPDASSAGFFKVARARLEKEMAANLGDKIWIPELGEPDDPKAWVLASEQLAAEQSGKEEREGKEEE